MADGQASMRFCMVTTFYPPYSFGGDAVFVQRLSRELAARGHRVDVVQCIDAYRLLGGSKRVEAEPEPPGITVHRLASRAGFLWPLAMQQTGGPAFASRRLRTLLDGDFDVIHFHNVSLMGGPGVLACGRALKLYTMHEYWLVCPTHVLYRNGREPCERRTCLTCTLAHGRPPQLWRRTGRLEAAARHVDAFLALSAFSVEAHRSRGFNANFELLPPFVPRADGPVVRRAAGDRPYFLFAGRLETIKGPHTLIPHFPGASGPELWIAGRGSLDGALRRMAAGHPRIRLLGHVEEPRLSELFRGAEALLVPSLCDEVFPLVILEAFRQGTPVVARRMGGMTEAVGSSGGGFTYSSERELDEAITALAGDPAMRTRMGERACAAFEERWTPEAHIGRYLAIIAGLRGEAGRASRRWHRRTHSRSWPRRR
jgi:glycosyltransferase involved in cell wall biosynthesis